MFHIKGLYYPWVQIMVCNSSRATGTTSTCNFAQLCILGSTPAPSSTQLSFVTGISPLQPDINLTSTPPTGWPETTVYPTHITRVGTKTFLQIDQYNFLLSNFFPSLWQTNLGTLRIIFLFQEYPWKDLI